MARHSPFQRLRDVDRARPSFSADVRRVFGAGVALLSERPSTPPVHISAPPAPTPITGAVAVRRLARASVVCTALVGAGWPLAAPAAATQAVATPLASAPVDAADRHFMSEATTDGMIEIVFGRIAQEKGNSDAVRTIGAHLVDDHIKGNETLKALAAMKGVPLPTGLSSEEKATASHMKKLKGANFDRQYLARMFAGHQKSVALFTRASSEASDPDVKSFAAATLPTLKSHLEMLKQASAAPVTAPPKRGTAARE